MHTYVVRRLLALVPTLFFASLIVFVTVRLIPGDVIDLMLSQNDISAGKLSRDQLIAALGLDKPMWEQYGRWVGAILLRGDFGNSLWQSTPVGELLAARLPVTFELGLLALIIALTIALPIGVYSAIRQDTAGDYVARSLSFLMLAVPAFWTGTMVMVLPSIWWGWSPEVKYVPFTDGPAAEPEADADPGLHPRHRAVGDHDAAYPHADARSAAPGLYPHRLGQGPQRAHRHRCATRCATRWCRW